MAAWWERWFSDFGVELAGVGLLYGLVEYALYRHHLRQLGSGHLPKSSDEDTKPHLLSPLAFYIAQLKRAPTREARQFLLDDMRRENLLRGTDFSNLDLSGANFYEADLKNTSFEGCNLTEAYLVEADLRGANLSEATLDGAELSWADLQGSFLGLASLKNTWLLQSNLQGVYLKNTTFDHMTRLPDGTLWKPETDMERFTKRDHNAFWRPDPGLFGELPRWYRRNGLTSMRERDKLNA